MSKANAPVKLNADTGNFDKMDGSSEVAEEIKRIALLLPES